MGHISFLTWNKWQGAPALETTHTPGKRTGGVLRHLVLALALAFPACALALPDGGQISAGSGNIGQNGSTLTVTQTSPKLAINWQGFNIGQSETVNFNQPGTDAIALNRVLGQAPSQILGNLRANGQVFVLNPNGVLFGSTAQVNVGGLIASSLSLNDTDFLAGSHTFRNSGAAGSVVNQGALTAANGGYLALLAPEVRNEGVISATLGTALLAAGDTVTLHLHNGSLLSYTIDQGTLNALAENKHLIRADGGQVILSAQAADALTRSVVNNTGIIEAHTIKNQNGVITLLGDRRVGQVNVSGTLDASGREVGESGGTVKVLGYRIALLDSARLDVSGTSGGGTALVGGNFQGTGPEPNATLTFFAPGAQLNADALIDGNGGKVILWADDTMRAFGSISARGGVQGGNGGFVEVSGKQSLGFAAVVDTSAPSGRTGSLLLDPAYAIISSNPDGTVGDTETINATSLVTNLNSTDITVLADTKVTVDAAVNASANANAHNLALDTPTIDLNAAITLKTGGVLSGTASTVNVNSPTADIQNGVDVAANSATVNVAAGTYMLNTRLNVNKPLTLRGAQHGIDPRTAAALRTAGSGAETIVDGNNTLPILLRIGGDTVTVDGFEFRNGTGDLIDSTAVISAPVIRYNLIHHSAGPGDEGVQIRNANGAILEYNRVYDTGIGDGLNIADSTNGTIRFNEVHDNSSVNAAIYVYGSTNTTIQGNYVHDVHDKEGIKLGDSGGGDELLSGGSIIDNVVENTFSDGITVYTSDVTVSGNQVSNSRSQDAAIFVYYNVDNITIEDNTISNNGVTSDGGVTYAIRIGSGTKYPTNVTVTGNTFSNNEAQFFDNNGTGQIATIFGANTFDRSAMTSGDNRIWSNIQDGIAVAAIGGTVTVGAGAYSEAVNISTDSVTMKLAGNTTIDSLTAGGASTSVDLQNFMLTAGDGSTTTYSGIIGGTGSLTKTGSGTLTLSGINTYSGNTTINGGTLSISADENLGTAPGAPTPGSLTLNNGTLQTTDDVALDTNRGIALTGAGTFDTATATTLNIFGIIDGAGTLTKTGSGTLTLSGANTYTGNTTINGGILSISADENLGTAPVSATPGSLTLNNATLQTTTDFELAANRGLALTGAGAFETAVGTTLNISGIVAGAGTLTKAGDGILTLFADNTYTGATTINAGTLIIDREISLGTAPETATPGHLTFNGGTLEVQSGSPLATNRGLALTGNGTINISAGRTLNYAGIIAGSGALSKGLGGTLELSGANSYTGLTTVSAGTLRLAGGAAIADSGAVNLSTSGATLRLLANETIGSLTGIAGTSVILQNNSTLTTGDANNTTFAGVMSGTGGNLSKQGAGTFTLSGLNTYTGLTTVNQGILAYGITNALDAGAITVNNGTLDIGAFSDTVAAVTLASGSITGTTGVLTGTSYAVQSGTISARLAGTGALSKTTDGTVTLSGANTYTGATTVTAGTLVAANAAALGATAGSTTVANGATLEIANVAIGDETVTLNGTGIGGNGALTGSGTASLSGPVTLAAASALGAAAGNALAVNGTIEGAGALDILGGGTITLGSTVGSNTALASFSTAAGTALAVNGGLIRTTGAQTYNGATTFDSATTLRTTAGGTVSAPGAITATAGMLTLDTGAGDATFTNSGNDFSTVAAISDKNISLVDANGLTLAGIAATGLVDARTQTGDLTLNSAIVTTSTSANAVTLVADAAATPNATGSGGNFKNPGSAAITTGDGGAWRIYTGNPTDTSRGGLAEAGKRYNVDDGSDPLASGNRLYFRIQPTLTLTAENKTKTYGDANPAFTSSSAGLIDSDLLAAAISSGPSYTVDGTTSTSGQLTAGTLHNITPSAATATSLGYSLAYANGALTVNQKALTISATGVSKVYDSTTAATVTYADNRITGDLLTIGGTAAYLDKNVGAGKSVNVSGITLTNTDAGNYTFNPAAATTADITPRALLVAANDAIKYYTGVAFMGGNGVTFTGLANGETAAVLGGTLAYGGASQGAITPGSYLITPLGLTADNYTITYTDGILTMKPAIEMLPAVAEAVISLPGGAGLLTAFNTARAVTMVLIKPSDSQSITETDEGLSAQPHPADIIMENNHTVEQVGNLILVNGGVKLPADTKSSPGEAEKGKSDSKTSGE